MKPLVLVVDDNPAIRLFCQVELEAAGYQVLVACDGLQATELLKETQPHVIVLDIHMPKENGFALARRLQDLHPTLPVVFYTSNHSAARMSGCIVKSADIQPLIEAIDQKVRNVAAPMELKVSFKATQEE